MQTRTYTERSNARRAARAAGLDPDIAIIETQDGFEVRFAPLMAAVDEALGRKPAPAQLPIAANRAQADENFSAMTEGSRYAMPSHKPAEALDDIPEFCKIPTEKRRAAWEKNPPKAATAQPRESLSMAKAKAKDKKPKGASGADKTSTLLKMLQGKGSTVEALTKALDWLPHTLRARISRLPKDDKKIKITRERVDGVTTYRLAS